MTNKQDMRAGVWLLAIDGSAGANYAAQYVAGMGKRLGVGEIQVINVQAPAETGEAAQKSAAGRAQATALAEKMTDAARRMLKAAGLNVRLEAAVGPDPASLIAGAGKKGRIDEIVMGTRGMTALQNLALGSVAYKVLHMARVPVTLIPVGNGAASRRPSERQPVKVLLACDGSRPSQRAVDYVCAMGRACPISVRLVNVQPRIVSGNVRSFFSHAQIEAFYRDEGMKALRGAIRHLDQAGVKHEVHVAAGPMAETIVDVAHQTGCDRIVMGTRGLAAAGSLLMGSVTYGVVQRADLPVTLVK